MEVQLKALQVLLDNIDDPAELALVREAYHAVATGESQLWAVERPKDIDRLRGIFMRVFHVP